MLKTWLKLAAHHLLNEPAQRWLKKRYFVYQHRIGAVEETEMRFLNQFVRSGDTVLDIGANVGFYTVRLSRLVGPQGMVHAFEPIQETFDILAYVTQTLKLRNVLLYLNAVADQVGVLEMLVPKDSRGIANFYLAHLDQNEIGSDSRVSIRSKTIECLREKGLPTVSFIKCDVEGAELLVLKGAQGLLVSDRPVLLCEVSERSQFSESNGAEVFVFLHRLGFQGYSCCAERLVRCENLRHGIVNYFFIPEERVVGTRAAESGFLEGVK
jgi:FkbM family methyltransferase